MCPPLVCMCMYKITQEHMDWFSPNLVRILLGRLCPDDRLLELIARQGSRHTQCTQRTLRRVCRSRQEFMLNPVALQRTVKNLCEVLTGHWRRRDFSWCCWLSVCLCGSERGPAGIRALHTAPQWSKWHKTVSLRHYMLCKTFSYIFKKLWLDKLRLCHINHSQGNSWESTDAVQ